MDNQGEPFTNPDNWNFKDSIECNTLEYLVYPNRPDPVITEVVVNDNTIHDWLTKDLAKQPSDNIAQKPVSGLRVIFLKFETIRNWWTIHCTEAAARLIHTHMNRPRDFLPHLLIGSFFAYNYSAYELGNQRYVGLGIQMPWSWVNMRGQTIISYDRNTQITHAVVISEGNSMLRSSMINSIKQQKKDWSNPLLFTSELFASILEFYRLRVKSDTGALFDINVKIGHFDYVDRVNINAPQKKNTDLNFVSLSKALNMTGQNTANLGACFTSMLQVLSQLRVFKELIKDTSEDSFSQGKNAVIEKRLDMFTESCNCYLHEVQAIEKRCNVLLQVFYQYMAQNDAKVNIELARSSAAIAKASKEDSAVMRSIALESKKDTTAMKTLSILGMVFLPGAFVAAIFAMPVFDWDANGVPVMKPAFRYYWAITAPLTVTILLIWSLMTLLPWSKWIAGLRKDSGLVGTPSLASESNGV